MMKIISTLRNYRLALRKFVQDRLALTGLLIISFLVLTGIFAPIIAPYPEDVYAAHITQRLQSPGLKHLCGTDEMGRDILSRIIFGSRTTLTISFIAVFSSLALGVIPGLIAGYFENWFSEVIMRIADIFLSIPQAILALLIAATLGPSIPNVILALSVTYWPWFTRIVYSQVRTVKKAVSIQATQALGAGYSRIIVLHILPNSLSPIIIRTTIGMGYTILTAAMLGFLGVGAPPPTPDWGAMISAARNYLPGSWWFATFPGLAIFLVVTGFNMFGDGLRDILDPRIRKSQ